MANRAFGSRLAGLAVLSLAFLGVSRADTLKQITAATGQGGNDSLTWTQKGADGTVLPVSFTATTALANTVTVSLGTANSVVSVVCTATPCSWTGTGFTAGHSLLWTSDAGNGGSGPATLTFTKGVAGVGALIQADLPGAFTAQIQLYNGATLLGTFTQASDTAGDPVYLGALDQTGTNITKAVYSLTTCAQLCTDFGLDTVAVNATAVTAPAVTLTPSTLTFASTNVGVTTAAQVVTVQNSGTAALTLTSETITGTNATSFLTSGNTCTTSLAVGASCTVSVEFKPTAAGLLTASLAIADNATGTPQLVPLRGTGVAVAPAVTLTPTALTFASTVVGSTTAAQVVTVKNSGTAALTLTSETITGTNATSFLKSATTCTTSLAVGASCTVSVTFKPAAAGALTASLSIADNATGTPQLVALSGTGTATAAPAVTLTPTSLAFPPTIVGTTSNAQLVTLKNSGTAPLTITSLTVGGTNPTSFVSVGNCPATLAAGASCSGYFGFKPASATALSATVSIVDNAPGSPHKVTLTGTGTAAPVIKLSATSLAFGTTKAGQNSAYQTVTITNSGTATVTLNSITLTGTNPGAFIQLNTCGASLAPSASCAAFVSFNSLTVGSFTAKLSIADNGAASPQSVTLTGTAN